MYTKDCIVNGNAVIQNNIVCKVRTFNQGIGYGQMVNCSAGSKNIYYQFGRVVVLYININISAAGSAGQIWMNGLPIPINTNFFGVCTKDPTAKGTAVVQVNASGQLVSVGATTTGWYQGMMYYITAEGE